MMNLFDGAEALVQILLFVFCLVAAIPPAVVLAQVLLALLPAPPSKHRNVQRPRVTLLVPAHNESAGILPTLAQALAQMHPGDRLVVVADNCSDDTAAQARAAGAEVCERHDVARRGKGYALDFGVQHLQADPPAVVVVLDADCTLGPDCINLIASLSHATGRPVQARYLMTAADLGLKARVAEFAMRVKNWVRPRGMHRVGLPCGLYGTGMAFPWSVAVVAPFASGHLAEDMQLGVRLAEIGAAPLLCEEAHVNSVFAGSQEGAQSQRTRWEHGHLSLLLNDGPRLLFSALLKGRWAQALQVVDMLVPPLALLAALQTVLAAGMVLVWWQCAWAWPAMVSLTGCAMLLIAILLARSRFAADVLSLMDLLSAPVYVLNKIPLYLRYLINKQVEWVRTRRD